MINMTSNNTLNQIEEENVDIAAYQVETGLEDLFGMVQYCRHNNPELFEESLVRFKEVEARVLEMASRIKSMSRIIKLEQIIGGSR